MNDIELSRRKILATIAAAGGAGSLVGAGTGAVFSDEELFTNNSVQASTKIGGVVDLDVTVEDLPGDGDGVRYPISLPLDDSSTTTNNPAYIWLRTVDCPTSDGSLDEVEIKVTVTDGDGNTQKLGEGPILDVLNDFRTGVPVVPNTDDHCLQPGETWFVDIEVTESPHGEPISFGLEFYAQQCRYQTGSANPWDESDVIEECGSHSSSHEKHAISFIAFCSSEKDLENAIAEDDLTVTRWKAEGVGTEPLAVEWESDKSVDTIVLKAGPEMENFSPSDRPTSGTVEVGEGDPANANQSPPNPCPSGSGPKFNFESGTFQKE